MNENIGVKGCKRDRKRTILISKKKKQKLESINKKTQIKKLEKKVKKIQLETLIKVIPIAVLGTAYKVVTDPIKKHAIINEQNIENKKEVIFKITQSPRKIILIKEEPKLRKVEVKEQDQDKIEIKQATLLNQVEEKTPIESVQQEKVSQPQPQNNAKKKNDISKSQDIIKGFPILGSNISKEKNAPKNESSQSNRNLKKVKNIRIIEYYEKRLNEIKYDLKKLSFDYWTLENELEKTYTEKEAQIILDKLNVVIKKLDELKERLKVDNINEYDDAYIHYLVEEYINEFNDKKVISEIKNSDLYILLSEKINSLDQEKNKFSKNIENKKDKLKIDNIKFEQMKEKYANYENFNNTLIDFQNEQDKLLREIEEKIKSSSSIVEKTESTFKIVKNQCAKLLEILGLQIMIPGLRSAKAMAATTVTYMFFLRKSLNLKVTKRKYNVIQIKNYSKDIEKSLDKINDVSNLLDKTSYSLDKMIVELKEQYKDYFAVIPDCNKLLNNLLTVKSQLQDKEYEIKRIKEEQKINLENNNQKVKKLDNKEVM